MQTGKSCLLIIVLAGSGSACGGTAPDPGAGMNMDMGPASPAPGTGSDPKPAGMAPADGGGQKPSAGGGSGTPAAIACSGDAAEESMELISSFEDGTKGLNLPAGWKGGFYVFNDMKTEDASIQSLEIVENERCSDGSSHFALCSKGGGFTIWGAGVGTDLNSEAGAKMPIDLSAYSGISFYIARRSGTKPAAAKVIIADKNTAPEGGACADDGPDTGKCDPFVKSVMVTNNWTKQTVMFSALAQGKWGKPVPTGFSKNAVYGFQVQFDPMIDFDVCIDHVALIK